MYLIISLQFSLYSNTEIQRYLLNSFCQNLFAFIDHPPKEILKINYLLQPWHEQFCKIFFFYIIPDTCCAALEENNYNEVSALYVWAYQLSINFPQDSVNTPCYSPLASTRGSSTPPPRVVYMPGRGDQARPIQ